MPTKTKEQLAVTRFKKIVAGCRKIKRKASGPFDEAVVIAFGGESFRMPAGHMMAYIPVNEDYYVTVIPDRAALCQRYGKRPLKYVDDCVKESRFAENDPVLVKPLA